MNICTEMAENQVTLQKGIVYEFNSGEIEKLSNDNIINRSIIHNIYSNVENGREINAVIKDEETGETCLFILTKGLIHNMLGFVFIVKSNAGYETRKFICCNRDIYMGNANDTYFKKLKIHLVEIFVITEEEKEHFNKKMFQAEKLIPFHGLRL